MPNMGELISIISTLKRQMVESSAETTELIRRWREIVKQGIYRKSGEGGNVTMNESSDGTKEKISKNDYNR